MSDDLGEVLTAISAWGQGREAEGRAAAEAEAAERIAELNAAMVALRAEYDAYRASHPAAPPEPEPVPLKVIGMSSSAGLWTQRLAEVGPQGITARRIFADLARGGDDKLDLIRQAYAAGQMPVVSYKVGGNIGGALSGDYDRAADQAAAYLETFDVPAAVTIWHEPNPDITADQYANLHRRLIGTFQRGKVKVGPILNGWLLDRQRALFESFLPDDLLQLWDFVGIDTYQSGTQASPGPIYSGHRIAPLLDVLAAKGHPDKPLLVGEFNGWTADAIRESGETFLSTPTLWAALMFNSEQGGKGLPLTGDRLAAFQAIKADPRVKQ